MTPSQAAKFFQIKQFAREEYDRSLNAYFENFLLKEWIVIESRGEEFITNDNPGFSFTQKHLYNNLLDYPRFLEISILLRTHMLRTIFN